MSLANNLAKIETTTARLDNRSDSVYRRGMKIGDKKSSAPENILRNTQRFQQNVSGTLYTPKNIVGKAKGTLNRLTSVGREITKGIADTRNAFNIKEILGIKSKGNKLKKTRNWEIAPEGEGPKYGDASEIQSVDDTYQESLYMGGLNKFYNRFGNSYSANKDVATIDPFNTFECFFTFFPSLWSADVQSIKSSSTVEKNPESISLIEKIIKQSKFQNSEEEAYTGGVLDMGIYIQRMTIPNIQVDGVEEVTSLVGKFPVPGNLVQPDNNNFQMEIVNVSRPVIENIFYPWMRETTLPEWIYDDQPFTTAEITVDFTEHSNVKYHFLGCRPTQIMLTQPDQQPTQSLARNVQFTFDFMTIETIE